MKMNLYFALLFSIAFIFSSCEKDELDELPVDTEESCIFKYGDTYYKYNPEVIDEAAIVFNKLNENPSLATFVKDDGTVEYFDCYNDLIESINKGNTGEIPFSRSTGIKTYYVTETVTLKVYSEYSYVGDCNSFTLKDDSNSTVVLPRLDVPNLSSLRPNLDQRISSMELICDYRVVSSYLEQAFKRPYVTFCDKNSGHIGGPDTRTITYGVTLHKPPYGYVHKFNKHWNDAPRSLSLFFAYNVPGAL